MIDIENDSKFKFIFFDQFFFAQILITNSQIKKNNRYIIYEIKKLKQIFLI